MAYSLFGERPAAAAHTQSLFSSFRNWLEVTRRERAHRAAFKSLLELDEHLLDDVGVSRQDIVDAMERPLAGRSLEAKRARRARAWYRGI